jgi:hypothetical protein
MIHILQFLCPQRHCYTAIAWDDQSLDLSSAHLRLGMAIAELHKAGVPIPCAICGSTNFHPEDGVTPWTTMEEARPFLLAGEVAQQFTREMLTRRADRN